MLSHKKPKPTKQQVLIIGASPRKNGNSDAVIEKAVEGIKSQNIHTVVVQLRDLDFRSCIGCEKCRKSKKCTIQDDMQALYPHIVASSAMLWVCPTHTYNVTALMKAFIDRLYTFYNFNNNHPRGWSSQLSSQKRKASIVAIAEQVDKEDMGFTLDSMKLSLTTHGYEIIDEMAIFGVFEKGKVKTQAHTLDDVYQLGKNLSSKL